MISVSEAKERILSAISQMPLEQVVITDSFGRVAGEDIRSRRTQPPMPVSAMDGYAVRAADVVGTPVELPIVGYAPAGGSYDKSLNAGEAVRIFTGAPVPEGADAIVIQEDTEEQGETVLVNEGAKSGTYIRPAGLDFSEDDILIPAGTRMTARHVGLMAAMNVPWMLAHRRPRVAILATGDEIVMPGDPVGRNQIVSSNAIALAAFVQAMGGHPVLLGIAPDDRDGLRHMAAGIVGNDILVIERSRYECRFLANCNAPGETAYVWRNRSYSGSWFAWQSCIEPRLRDDFLATNPRKNAGVEGS